MLSLGPILSLPFCIVAAVLAASLGFEGEPSAHEWRSADGRGVIGEVTFRAELDSGIRLTAVDRDIGNDVIAWAVTREEFHTEWALQRKGEPETIEAMAMRGDHIDFTIGERLALRRHRHDRWPLSDEAIALAMQEGR